MKKKTLPTLVLTALLTLSPILFGLILWNRLPDPMPSHFNLAGECDGFMPKAAVVFALPAGLLLVHLLCAAATLTDPKRKNIEGKPFLLVLWLCPAISILLHSLTYAYALGRRIDVPAAFCAVVGVMFILLGNYLPKCGQNYTLGIRTPWALNDEGNWHATHRFAGKLFVAAGILVVALAFLAPTSPALFWGLLAVIALCGVVPVAYSYLYEIRHRAG